MNHASDDDEGMQYRSQDIEKAQSYQIPQLADTSPPANIPFKGVGHDRENSRNDELSPLTDLLGLNSLGDSTSSNVENGSNALHISSPYSPLVNLSNSNPFATDSKLLSFTTPTKELSPIISTQNYKTIVASSLNDEIMIDPFRTQQNDMLSILKLQNLNLDKNKSKHECSSPIVTMLSSQNGQGLQVKGNCEINFYKFVIKIEIPIDISIFLVSRKNSVLSLNLELTNNSSQILSNFAFLINKNT